MRVFWEWIARGLDRRADELERPAVVPSVVLLYERNERLEDAYALKRAADVLRRRWGFG